MIDSTYGRVEVLQSSGSDWIATAIDPMYLGQRVFSSRDIRNPPIVLLQLNQHTSGE